MEKWWEKWKESPYALVGLGKEWSAAKKENYEDLASFLKGKDYFIVTLNTNRTIWNSSLEPKKITAPCGNDGLYQCGKGCTGDLWKAGEVADGLCPHCKSPLVKNTVEAQHYVEEGYLPSWKAYTSWLMGTVNRNLFVLELGADFSFPGILRLPFEKTVYLNQKAYLLRINEKFPQIAAELSGRAQGKKENSILWISERNQNGCHYQ